MNWLNSGKSKTALAVLGLLGLAAAAGTALAPQTAFAQGEVRIGVWDLPPGKGNPYTGRSVPSIFVWDAVFDPLVRPDENGQPAAALASSWQNIDPSTWRFTLRPGATFSNGKPVNAAAVVATIEYLMSEEGKATSVGREVGHLAGVSAIDDLTVEIKTSRPDPVLTNRLALVSIVEPGQWAALGAEGFADQPVGTGPYRVSAWGPGDVTLTANASSWRAGKLDKLTIIELPERPARLQAIQSGQIDIGFGFSPDNIAQLEGAGLKVSVTPAPQVMSLAFVTEGRDTPLDDVRVRQALNYAVDRQAMADTLLAGFGKAASHGATPAAFGYNPNLQPYPYDPAKAKELLAAAGYGNGFDMVAEVVVGSFPADSEIYQQTAADLGKVGVNVTLQQIRFPEWLKKFLNNSWDGAAFGLSWNASPYMDSVRPYTYFTCAKTNAFFCDQSVMPLYEQSNTEFDPDKRKAILWQLHEATRNAPPALFLVEQIDVTATAAKVTGLSYVNRSVRYHELGVR